MNHGPFSRLDLEAPPTAGMAKADDRISVCDADLDTIVKALVDDEHRVQRLQLSDRVVWIKRYGTKKRTWWLRLHRVAAPMVPIPIFRPSPILEPMQMKKREVEKLRQFSGAGFSVPEIICSSDKALILSDAGETVERRLKRLGGIRSGTVTKLLAECAGELGKAHSLGLCHGRPHPRDMFVSDNGIGFLDFEEDPASVMPLQVAQVRDIFLFLLQTVDDVVDLAEIQSEVLAAWRKHAPASALNELQRLVRVIKPLFGPLRVADRLVNGKDLHRFAVTAMLLSHLVL
ncbi:MAG TPA: serine/threonine protein phosphatase [Rhizobium sp.]